MPSADPTSSSPSSASSSLPPHLAAMFSGITPQQLSTLSTQLGMTSDEHSRMSTAMQDPTFLQLLADYAQEMSDPAVKRQQEEALRKMEQESGVSGQAKGDKASRAVVPSRRSIKTSELDVD